MLSPSTISKTTIHHSSENSPRKCFEEFGNTHQVFDERFFSEKMDGSMRYSRRRSGYEPSDTETDWHDDSPTREHMGLSSVSRLNSEVDPPNPARRRHSKSPYKPPRVDDAPPLRNPDFRRNLSPLPHRTYSDINRNVGPFTISDPDNNIGNDRLFSQSERRTNNPDSHREHTMSPFTISERRRHISPYKTAAVDQGHDLSRGRDRPSYSRRASSAPKSRLRERVEQKKEDRNLSPLPERDVNVSHKNGPSVGEINEMVANAKISKGLNGHVPNFESTDSISPGSIFFPRDYNASQNVAYQKNVGAGPRAFLPRPPGFVDRNSGARQGRVNTPFNHNARGMSRSTANSSSVVSRQSSNVSDTSGRTSASTRKFIANRQKSQSDTWFSCIKKGSCKTSNKSPEKDRPFDEASFIGKAIVVESLRPFWADKHQPASLIGFTCHKQEALQLQQLASSDILPHILFKGPPGSGKKALTMALLREIYGDPVWNISHDLRYFHILQESRPMQVVVPVSSSPHHVELNVYLEPKAAYALTALVKKISSEYGVTPEISTAPTNADHKVMVLYDVDKATENIQHLIKWIMDCYSDSCKLILLCEDDVDILESVKSRCKVIKVESPVTHEGMEVLIQIAKREGFELSMSFAAKIATKSKQNLRRAIMALEACKAHNYPFDDDQPIPVGWEEAVMELAADILADPFPKRLIIIRGKIHKLLADYVHSKLILLKLVEQFLRGVEASIKRELYYWYAYYDKRLPTGTSAILKLEEFVAKFMSIYRKSSSNRQFS